jgi:hypothetical protein
VTTTVQVKVAAGFTDEAAEIRYADTHGLAHQPGGIPRAAVVVDDVTDRVLALLQASPELAGLTIERKR